MAKRKLDIDKIIERKLLGLIPGLPNLAEQFMGRVQDFDGSEPMTLLEALKQDFRVFTEMLQGKESRLGRLASWLLRRNWLQDEFKSQNTHAITLLEHQAIIDPRYSLLMKLIHKVDEQAALLPVFAGLLGHANPERMLDPQCRPLRFLQEANSKSSESRATAVVHALKITAEALYKPYVTTVWRLSYLKGGDIPPTPPNFGPLLGVAHQRLSDYPGLIEPDAAWTRNAAAHEQYEYLVKKDALKMWDANHPPTEVPVNDLLAMVERMYLISGKTIAYVSQIYMLRELLVSTGLLDAFVECVQIAGSNDQSKIDAAEQTLKTKVETIFEPVQKFYKSRGIQLA